jgi:hypothetical protein
VDRVREQDPAGADPEPAVCASCPVCAVITVLRGGRSDLAVRLADHAAGVLAVLRAALEEGVGAADARGTAAPGPGHTEPSAHAESPRPAEPRRPAAEPPPAAAPPRDAAEPRRAGPDQGRSGADPRRESERREAELRPGEPRSAPPRRRPTPRGGRGGRMVQHIEISRDGRGRPRGEPSRKPC